LTNEEAANLAVEEVLIVRLERPEEDFLDQVEELFSAMYSSLEEYGLIVSLQPDGARKWRRNLESSLGVSSILTLGVLAGRVLSFHHTVLAVLPPQLGGEKVARMMNMFVIEEGRGKGLVGQMFRSAEEWMRLKGATAVEGQVQMGNEGTIGLWMHYGLEPEFIQLRKVLA
jgi:GNAT superfamily N-acetyltransferase